jgi:hypothetical protein
VVDQLAEQVGGLVRVVHRVPPDRAELGVDVRDVAELLALLAEPRRVPLVLAQALDQRVDLVRVGADVGVARIGPLGVADVVARVVDEEADLGVRLRSGPDVAGRRCALVEAGKREPLVGGDDRGHLVVAPGDRLDLL